MIAGMLSAGNSSQYFSITPASGIVHRGYHYNYPLIHPIIVIDLIPESGALCS
jgi:hypothetical protein